HPERCHLSPCTCAPRRHPAPVVAPPAYGRDNEPMLLATTSREYAWTFVVALALALLIVGIALPFYFRSQNRTREAAGSFRGLLIGAATGAGVGAASPLVYNLFHMIVYPRPPSGGESGYLSGFLPLAIIFLAVVGAIPGAVIGAIGGHLAARRQIR